MLTESELLAIKARADAANAAYATMNSRHEPPMITTDERVAIAEFDGKALLDIPALVESHLEASKQIEEQRELVPILDAMLDLVGWMSGSSDFAPGGIAHAGWVRALPEFNAAMKVCGNHKAKYGCLPRKNYAPPKGATP